jgi:NAD-dependent deacetylase
MAPRHSPKTPDRDILRAADLWRQAERVLALTGAGVSVASGIPDFRSPEGLWARYDPAEVATLQALRAHPRRVWEFLVDAALVFGDARPNPAHTALAELEAAGLVEAVVTQNIDGLHQAAGSKNVVEFHGSARRYYCMGCKADHDPDEVRTLTREELPWTCGRCGGVVRPDFVFFGEMIPEQAMRRSARLAETCDLAVILGTSGEVAPANTLPGRIKSRGGRVVEVNLGTSMFGGVSDVRIDAPVEEVLPTLARLLII